MFEVELIPRGPYSLRASFGHAPDLAGRRGVDVNTLVVRVGDGFACAEVWQRTDGTVVARVTTHCDPQQAVAELRFVLALDDDHTPFLEMAAGDDLLARLVIPLRGLRPMRTSVSQALLHGFAGQLISAREAWGIERRVSLAFATAHEGLLVPLSSDQLRAASTGELVRHRLAPRRAAALAHAARVLDLDRLRHEPVDTAIARLTREPLIGPWTSGIVALRGLGSYRYGIAGDLNLMRLCSNLHGRTATVADTTELLERYGEWGGLASLHLVRHPLASRRTGR